MQRFSIKNTVCTLTVQHYALHEDSTNSRRYVDNIHTVYCISGIHLNIRNSYRF